MLQHNRRIAHQSLQTPFGTTATETANSRRHGTERIGILQVTHRLTIQRQEFADTSVQTAITQKTMEQPAFPTQKPMLVAQIFLRLRSGTRFRVSHRHGTDQAGSRQQQEVTTKLQAQVNADTNAAHIIHGTTLNA